MPLANDSAAGFGQGQTQPRSLPSHTHAARSLTPQPNGSRGRTQPQSQGTTRKSTSSDRGKENVQPPLSREEVLAMKMPVPSGLPRGQALKNPSKLNQSTTVHEPIRHTGYGKQGSGHVNPGPKVQTQARNVCEAVFQVATCLH
jgi:hypothetical protein